MISDVTSIANLGSKATPKEVSEKVQGMFTEVMLKSMEESVDAEGGLFGDSASADIYRGMFTQQLAATMTKQMKSPLEGELDKALNKSAAAHGGQTDGTETKSDLPVLGLPVSGVISSPQGMRR